MNVPAMVEIFLCLDDTVTPPPALRRPQMNANHSDLSKCHQNIPLFLFVSDETSVDTQCQTHH